MIIKNRLLRFRSRVIRKWWHAPLLIVSLPTTLILIFLRPFIKIKLIRLGSERIGHYAMNTELLLCHLDKMKKEEKRTKYFFYTGTLICNQQLHQMWKRAVFILPFPIITEIIAIQVNSILLPLFGNDYKSEELLRFESGYGADDINGDLRQYPIHLFFTNFELQRGARLLTQLGIPVGAKVICLLVRDTSFLARYFPDRDWSYQSHRDCSIENFQKAALFLANKGYYVVRMGKTVLQSFNVQHINVIDYANHSIRSDFGDIYLSAHCTFFLSTAAGLDGVAEIFRRPIVRVDVPFPLERVPYWYPCIFFIIKKVCDKKSGMLISLREIHSILHNSKDIKKTMDLMNWVFVENNENEILEVVQEMESDIQQKTRKNIKKSFPSSVQTQQNLSLFIPPNLLTSQAEKFTAKMGRKFYEENFSTLR